MEKWLFTFQCITGLQFKSVVLSLAESDLGVIVNKFLVIRLFYLSAERSDAAIHWRKIGVTRCLKIRE